MKRHEDRARAARRKHFVRLGVEILEPRNLPSVQAGLLTNAIPNIGSLAAGADALTALPPVTSPTPTSSTGTSSASSITAGGIYPLTAVPALSSLPGARDSIWLNFTGDSQTQWGGYTNVTTPAFGDGTTFTGSELQMMQQIWQVVAEDYAPFNIDVTTVQPSNMGHGYTQQIDIGGNGSWTGGDYGGLTYVGSFISTGLPNISKVFSDNLDNNPIYIGDAISHEAGHSFGLVHQSVWNSSGVMTAMYNPGNAAEAPIMGYPYSATRAVWWDGVSQNGPTDIQDDMSIIASAADGFGYRPEPSNTTAATASPLTVSGDQVSAAGLIIHTTDQDYFSFTTGAGPIDLSVNVAYANNLAPTITLIGSNGQTVLAYDDPSPNFNATISTTVPAGTYYVVVGSHGGYDDDGQYTISGTIVTASTSVPTAPTGLTAAAGDAQVALSWNAVSGATSYNLYRGTSSGGETLLQSGLTGTSYTDTNLTNGTTYYYQVAAVNAAGASSPSSEVNAVPLTPPTVGSAQGVAIDAGGGTVGNFIADGDFSGGQTYSTTATINTSGVTNPAPQSVYQTERYGNFNYVVPNLTAGASYTVRLDFAELYWNAAGDRVFNVSINGQLVLNNFDIYATAGGKDIAIAETFTATANSSGQIVIAFTSVVNYAKVDGIEITPVSSPPSTTTSGGSGLAIDAGGGAVGNFIADSDFSGGQTYSTTAAINTSGVTNPAPQSVYQTERYGNFTYTVPNLTVGASYTVRLDFAELYWNAAGERLFNVSINGQQVLTNFDIYATAGGKDIAIAETFTATANSSGQIVLTFTSVKDNAKVDGIEITPVSSPPSTSTGLAIDAGGGAVGNFIADSDFSGGQTYSTTAAINTSGVTNPAPQSVYQTERYGNFTYTVPNLTVGGTYTVRLDFAELYWNAAGERLFNVSINGQQVLTNFDIYATAGGKDIAIAETFTATANSSGQIVLTFTSVKDNAKVDGIEITALTSIPSSSATPSTPPTKQATTANGPVMSLGNWLADLAAFRRQGGPEYALLDAFFAQWDGKDGLR